MEQLLGSTPNPHPVSTKRSGTISKRSTRMLSFLQNNSHNAYKAHPAPAIAVGAARLSAAEEPREATKKRAAAQAICSGCMRKNWTGAKNIPIALVAERYGSLGRRQSSCHTIPSGSATPVHPLVLSRSAATYFVAKITRPFVGLPDKGLPWNQRYSHANIGDTRQRSSTHRLRQPH